MAISENSVPPFLRMIRFFVGEAETEGWYTREQVALATGLDQETVGKLLRYLVTVGICETRMRNDQTEYTPSSELTYQDTLAKLNRDFATR